MRYRDCPTFEVSERYTTSPARLWELVTDIELPVRFSPELQGVEWVHGDSVAIGNRFRGHNKHPQMGEWTTESTVVEVEPERRWVWQIAGFDGPAATWAFEIDPGRDAVTLRQWARMGPGKSGLTMAIDSMPEKEGRIVANRVRDWETGMRANMAGIRDLLG
ncbi:polyketide cyclase [Actinokineospora bangkokensis]|uniref:Polyketide cyclase n=1 Tax=Actinokineospora bangkokensis TaxID=1193682 RepID=A0A1Q9LL12_9PSEU|nr:polyketide cyclase [Actinokineospora bangkokensis]